MRIRSLLVIPAAVLGLLLTIPILLVGLPVWLIGLLTPRLARLLTPTIVGWPALFEFDPALGWRVKGNVDCQCLEEKDDTFHVRTDEQGWPAGPTLADSQMVVLGDSHAFGYGVDHAASFFSRLHPHVRVKAIGVPGYNLAQEVLLMQRLAPQLAGKLVVWLVYIGNDLHETLEPQVGGYRCPFLRQVPGTDAWEVVTQHLSPATWTASAGALNKQYYPTLAALHGPSYLADRAYAAAGWLIGEAERLSRSAGFRLVVMTIPWPFAVTPLKDPGLTSSLRRYRERVDPSYPDRRIGEVCSRLGIQLVPLLDRLDRKDFKEHDDHWTERGHARVAKALAELYRTDRAAPRPLPRLPRVPDPVRVTAGL